MPGWDGLAAETIRARTPAARAWRVSRDVGEYQPGGEFDF